MREREREKKKKKKKRDKKEEDKNNDSLVTQAQKFARGNQSAIQENGKLPSHLVQRSLLGTKWLQ